QPMEGITSALAQAAWEHAERTIKHGDADWINSFDDGGGACAIMNANSDEALAKLLKEIPIYALSSARSQQLSLEASPPPPANSSVRREFVRSPALSWSVCLIFSMVRAYSAPNIDGKRAIPKLNQSSPSE